jgi:hypothetical protein
MAHRRYEEADFSEDCSDDRETLGRISGGFHCWWRLTLVTPLASKNKGRINNISDYDDDVVDTFFHSFLQCVKLEHLNLKWVGVKKKGRQIVYDSEDEEEDRNSKRAKPVPGY